MKVKDCLKIAKDYFEKELKAPNLLLDLENDVQGGKEVRIELTLTPLGQPKFLFIREIGMFFN